MAAFVEDVQDDQLIKVQLQLDSEDSELLMLAGEMRSLAAEALAAVAERAREMLRGRPLLRLVYVDDDGDPCTLTAGSVPDALAFVTPGEDDVCVLNVLVLAEQTPVQAHEEPPKPSAEQREAFEPPPRAFAAPFLVCEPPVIAPAAAEAPTKTEMSEPQAAPPAQGAPCEQEGQGADQLAMATEVPAMSADEAASALRALASHLSGDLGLLALEALLRHPDERLRAAAAAAAAAEAAHPTAAAAAAADAALSAGAADPGQEAAGPGAEDEPGPEDVGMQAEGEALPCRPEEDAGTVDGEAAPAQRLSARVLHSSPLVLGVEASEDESARGDVTEEQAQLLLVAPTAQGAYCCGRMLLPASAQEGAVPAEAKLVVLNDGSVPWPEACCLSSIAFHSFGFEKLQLGALQPGEAAELILDLAVPHKLETEQGRSASWVGSLVDEENNERFGPLIVFQVAWQ